MQMAVAEPAEGGTGRKNLYFLPQMDIVILKKCFIEIHLGMGRDILAPLLVLSHKYLSRQHKHTFVETKDVFDASDSRQPTVRFSSQNCCFR